MLLAALLDAGADLAAVRAGLHGIGTEPLDVTVSPVRRHGLRAAHATVHAPPSTVTRHLADIIALLTAAGLPDEVRDFSAAVFERLARAEAIVHRTSPEQVHFHEVGALDAIADVVGTAAGLHALGVGTVTASQVTLGTGMVRGEHGLLPVPAPAVLELLRAAGAPVWAGPAPCEMCTPTGAALLAALVTGWGPLPPMTVHRVGVGAGSRDLDELPNVLRLVVGEPAGSAAEPGTAVLLESNVDDLDPRLWPDVLDRLLAAGASDAWLSPILMKKGRPAHTLHVLCPTPAVEAVRHEMFHRTSTIGVRQTVVGKHALAREHAAVLVAGQQIGVKVARLGGAVVNVSVEFEDVRQAAEALHQPVKEVLRAATAAAHREFG